MSEATLTNSPSLEAAVDAGTIEQLRELGGGDELLFELIGIFLEDTPPRLEALRQAVADGDARNIGLVAHSMKSSAANVGAHGLSQFCKSLELAGKSETLDEVASLMTGMETEWELVRGRLEAILNG